MSSELNRLPPSIREDYRYMKFHVHAEEKVELGDLVDAVWNSCLGYLGTRGTSQADFWVIGNKFNEDKQEGVIRVKRGKIDEFRAALCLVDGFGDTDGFIEVQRMSGSIESLEN